MAKSLILVSLLIASTLAAESYYDEKFFQSVKIYVLCCSFQIVTLVKQYFKPSSLN